MKFELSVVLLSVCGLTAIVPVQARAFDGTFLAAQEAELQDRRDDRPGRRAKRVEQQEQQAEQVRSGKEPRHESERGYGYGYERRNYERNDGRGRRRLNRAPE